jgi:predicted O-methyltransferase YrrM
LNIWDRSINAIHTLGFRGFLRGARDSAAAGTVLLYELIVFKVAADRMIRSFVAKSSTVEGIDQLVDFSFGFSYMGVSISPVQQRREITELLRMLKGRKLRTVLEIGTDKGGTLFLFSRIASPDATIVSMNLPWSSLNAQCMKYRNLLFAKFASRKQTLNLLTANSHEHASLERVKGSLRGQKIDFLFIDGDHSYEGVKKDFEMYAPLVRNGGIIGFHDIAVNRGQKAEPVRDYWKQVKQRHKHKELEYSGGKGYGIGIVYWRGEKP